MQNIFDKLPALIGIIILLPVFILLAIAIPIDSKGPAFFVQKRVGKQGRIFGLIKFRTMRPNAEQKGKLTVGSRDSRITTVGYFLRKYKLDELPQLFNVLKGDMNLVGPRPEVPEFVAQYSEIQKKVLSVKPGITDYASLKYFNENDILAQSSNPQKTYLETVMPEKLRINLEYIERRSWREDLRIIWLTIKRIFFS